jgi:hypothetical protein
MEENRKEIKVEDIFNDEKRENIKKFIDEIKNPSEPNQALKDAAERLKDKELFKESNDRARKTLSEIKSLPIQETLEEVNDWEEILFDFIDFYPCILPHELFEWLEENYEIPKKKDAKHIYNRRD